VFAIASASTSMASGFVVDRIGPARLFMLAMVGLMTVCLLALVLNSIWMAIVYVIGMGMTGGAQRIVQGVIWAHYYGRVGLGRVQGSATMVGITGAAIGPLPLALMHRLTGNYDLGVIVMGSLPVLAILAITLGHPERRIEAGIAAERA
jgi:MFS family permease